MTNLATSSEVEQEAHIALMEEALERLAHHEGVVGYLILHPTTGSVMRFAGFDDNAKCARHYASKLHGFIDLTTSTIRTID